MLSPNVTLSVQPLAEETTLSATAPIGFAPATKNAFVSFFQGKGFRCMEDAQQQLKATYSRLTVRLAMSDSQVACGQGHAIYYLSIAPLNKRYKIVVENDGKSSAQQRQKVVPGFFGLRGLFAGKQKVQTDVTREHTAVPQLLKGAFTYTLLENVSSKTSATFMQRTTIFYSLEELLGTIFPKTTSFTGARALTSFLSFMFL